MSASLTKAAKKEKAEREAAATQAMLTRTSKYDRLEKIGEGTYGIVCVRAAARGARARVNWCCTGHSIDRTH